MGQGGVGQGGVGQGGVGQGGVSQCLVSAIVVRSEFIGQQFLVDFTHGTLQPCVSFPTHPVHCSTRNSHDACMSPFQLLCDRRLLTAREQNRMYQRVCQLRVMI